MVKLKFKKSYAEAATFKITNETRFSFIDKENNVVISPVSCRTFMAEVIWSFLGKGDIPRTNYEKETLILEETKLLLIFKSETEEEKAEREAREREEGEENLPL